MQTIKKEIEDLYYLEVTRNYIVVNDAYHGINVMSFDLNIVRNIELEEDFVINFSVKHNDELLLFCYENECAFYVNLKTGKVCRCDLSDYSDKYFSHIYFWKNDTVYLLGDGVELSVKVDLSNEDMIKLSPFELSEFNLQKRYIELLNKNIISYDNDNDSALIVQNANYCIWSINNQISIDMNIPALNQNKDGLPSDQLFCKTYYSKDAVVSISEKTILISVKERGDIYIRPPYELYRFFEGRVADYNEELVLFTLCNDNSSEGLSLLMRYNGIY